MLRQCYRVLVRQPWLRRVVVNTPVIREMALNFIAGEDLSAGIAALRALNARGIQGSLNYLGTHVSTKADAIAGTLAIIESLRRIHEEKLDSHISVKLTRIGFDVSDELCRTNLWKVLDCASQMGIFVRIDMEESRYVRSTMRLFEEARRGYGSGSVGIVVQSYLRHFGSQLDDLLARGSRIRLVKGGYWERDDIAYQKRAEIDRAFAKDIHILMARGLCPAIATHDTHFIRLTKALASAKNISNRGFEFQMLYGVRGDLQNQLAREGYTVRSYVPYGKDWYPYVMGCARRAAASKFTFWP